MAELLKQPELERLIDPLDPEAASLAPVEIRFQVRPGPGEDWNEGLQAECSINDQPAPSPGAVLSFREWEKDAAPTMYCYALSRSLHEGDTVKLRVRPGERAHGGTSELLFEKEFKVRVDGDQFRLE
jgi:hypothetical protein